MYYPPLIGLYAPTMQSGKSEVASCLETAHGYTLVKFAGPLKDMARALFEGMGYGKCDIQAMVEGGLKEKAIPGFDTTTTPRLIMQTLGTEWGREAIQNDLWIKVARAKAMKIIEAGGRVVIDDLRFPNEHDFIWSFPGSEVWQITRPGTEAYADHPSEGLLNDHDFDMILDNDGTIAELWDAVEAYLAQEPE